MSENEVKPSTPPPARYRVSIEIITPEPVLQIALKTRLAHALGDEGLEHRNITVYKID